MKKLENKIIKMWTFNYEGKVMSWNYETLPLYDGGFQARMEAFGMFFKTRKKAQDACSKVRKLLHKLQKIKSKIT